MFFAHPGGEVCQLLLSLIGSRQPPARLFSELSRNASPQRTLTKERCVTNLRTAAKETRVKGTSNEKRPKPISSLKTIFNNHYFYLA